MGERNFRFFLAFLLATTALQVLGLLFSGGALWAQAQVLAGNGGAGGGEAEQALREASRMGASAQGALDLAWGVWRAVVEAPGVAGLLAFCFSTLSGTGPLAARYLHLALLDSTTREQAALRRSSSGGGPFRGLGAWEGVRLGLLNCAGAMCGPLPPSRVWGGVAGRERERGGLQAAGPAGADLESSDSLGNEAARAERA